MTFIIYSISVYIANKKYRVQGRARYRSSVFDRAFFVRFLLCQNTKTKGGCFSDNVFCMDCVQWSTSPFEKRIDTTTMNSENVLSALERFKSRGADEVFDLIFSMIREETVQGSLTPEENVLNECIKSDSEYFEKYNAYQSKFMNFIKNLRIIEDLFLLDPQENVSERLHSMILYLYCDLSELLAKKSFECGVQYGKATSAR